MNTKWIDSRIEPAPVGDLLIAYSETDRTVYTMRFDGEDWHEATGHGWMHRVIYWMPAPPAPTMGAAT